MTSFDQAPCSVDPANIHLKPSHAAEHKAASWPSTSTEACCSRCAHPSPVLQLEANVIPRCARARARGVGRPEVRDTQRGRRFACIHACGPARRHSQARRAAGGAQVSFAVSTRGATHLLLSLSCRIALRAWCTACCCWDSALPLA